MSIRKTIHLTKHHVKYDIGQVVYVKSDYFDDLKLPPESRYSATLSSTYLSGKVIRKWPDLDKIDVKFDIDGATQCLPAMDLNSLDFIQNEDEGRAENSLQDLSPVQDSSPVQEDSSLSPVVAPVQDLSPTEDYKLLIPETDCYFHS